MLTVPHRANIAAAALAMLSLAVAIKTPYLDPIPRPQRRRLIGAAERIGGDGADGSRR